MDEHLSELEEFHLLFLPPEFLHSSNITLVELNLEGKLA